MSSQIDRTNDGYTDKLVKLLPAEGIAALTAIRGLIQIKEDNELLIDGVIGVVGIFVVLWALYIRGITAKRQIIFLLIGYLIWALNIFWMVIQGQIDLLAKADPAIPSVCVILYTLFIPFIFPPQKQAGS